MGNDDTIWRESYSVSTWRDIMDRSYLESIVVTVTEAVHEDGEKRNWKLDVTDERGTGFKLEIWHKHDALLEWKEGATYRVENAYGQVWDEGDKRKLHSSDSWSATRVDSDSEPYQILVLGDTHVGYRHRDRDDKPQWARNVDNRETLSASLVRARSLGVDLVLHAGDVFDDHPERADIDHVVDEIERTADAGVPFYYVLGNHDRDGDANRALAESSGAHLSGATVESEEGPVQFSGLDYGGGEFSDDVPTETAATVINSSILLLHDTPYPAVDEDKTKRYRSDPSALDLREFLDSADDWLDLIVSGHLHVGEEVAIEGYDVPVLMTGSTGQISKSERGNNPSTWLLTISDGEVERQRKPL